MTDPAKLPVGESDPDTPRARPKADPDTLVLRGTPGRIVRFRRGAIIAIAAFGSAAIIGVAWMALEPASLSVFNAQEEVALSAPPDTLADLPSDYGEVPQLGPPLPGDLGRPILEQQRELGLGPDQIDAEAARVAQEAEAERQRIAAEALAARESGIMMSLASGLGAPTTGSAATPPAAPGSIASSVSSNADIVQPDSNRQTRSEAFLADADEEPDISAHRLVPPASSHMLTAGSVIAASLLTGLNSDLPGFVTAQVTNHVYDSATGRTLLIPQGSRLIGRYDSVVAFGQDRALIAWQRLLLPDGSSIRLDNLPATDASGQAGLADRVDNHGWRLVRGVALSTLLGVGTELTVDGESELVRAFRESAQQNTSRAGERIVERELDVQPTITVRPGWPLRVIVHRDLVLRPWQARGD
ncbi:MAG: TrbI/VirB10 family protein [Pseudomonadota bacterium]